jgi:hypothetical protein
MSNALILGLSQTNCDGVYPRTRDGRCQGCGTTAVPHPRPWRTPKAEDLCKCGHAYHEHTTEARVCTATVNTAPCACTCRAFNGCNCTGDAEKVSCSHSYECPLYDRNVPDSE